MDLERVGGKPAVELFEEPSVNVDVGIIAFAEDVRVLKLNNKLVFNKARRASRLSEGGSVYEDTNAVEPSRTG